MIISRAPVRLSLGGGGTDLPSYYKKYGGFLIAASIDKYINIFVNKRFQDDIRLSYSKTEIVDNINKVEHNLFRECMKYTNVVKNIEIVSVSDVPSNSGLGTSSAFTVALLNALYTYRKIKVSKEKLSVDACHIEIDVLKDTIGKQDQYASAYGGFNAYEFMKDGKVRVTPIKISKRNLSLLQRHLLLFFFDKSRNSGEILKHQDSSCDRNDKNIISKLDRIKEIGLKTKILFEKGDIMEIGEILNEHWNIKKEISEKISNKKIDEIYSFALKNGASGGKIMGAGGGGFFMFFSPEPEKLKISISEKYKLKQLDFQFEFEGAQIIYK